MPGSDVSDPHVFVFPEDLLLLEATENDGDGDMDTNSHATCQTAMELPLGAPYEPATTRQAVQTAVLPLGHDLPMPISCEEHLYAYLLLRGQQHDTEQQYNVHREGFNISSPIKLPSATFIRYDIAPVLEAKWMLQQNVCWARQTGKNELVEVAYVAPSAHVWRDLLFTETFEKFKAADERSDSDRALHPEFVDSALFQDRETVLSTGRSVPRFQLADVFLAVGDRVDVDLQDGTGVRGAAVFDAYFAEAADELNIDACQHAGDFVVKCKLSGGEEANILAHYWHSSSLPPLSWMTDDAAAVSVTALRRILAECASSTGEATGDLGMVTASGRHERLEGDGRRRFCALAFSGYSLVTSRRHRRELCRQEVAKGDYKESHTVGPRGHPSKRIANRFVWFQAQSAQFI